MPDTAHPTLDLDDDPRFLAREHLATRIGWVALTAFLLAGLLGLLGPGPLSTTVSGASDSPVRVEHQRVTHYEADDSVTLLLDESLIEGDTLAVELTGAWLTGMDISSVSPQPDAQRLIPGGAVYEFAVARPADVEVSITFRAQELGRLPLTVSSGSSTVSLSQLVLP